MQKVRKMLMHMKWGNSQLLRQRVEKMDTGSAPVQTALIVRKRPFRQRAIIQ